MDNIKLIKLLKTLSKSEFRKFGEFVHSPFFNKNKNVISLFVVISEFYPDFSSKDFSKENIYKRVFNGEGFDGAKFKNYISDIYVLAEKFLGYKAFEKKAYSNYEFPAEFSVLYELRERGLGSLYESKHNNTLEKINAMPFKNESYYMAMHDLHGDYMWYLPSSKPLSNLNILQEYHDNFVYYALIKLMKFYSLMLHEKNTANVEYNYSLITELSLYIENNTLPENPTLQIYTKAFMLLRKRDEKSYLELKEAKGKYFEGLNQWDQRRILIHMYDYCAYMVNFKGDDSYNRDMFNIYKENLNRKFMTLANFLYPDFMNIVKIACRVGEFTFAENFISEYKSSLSASDKPDVLEFCYGVIAFSRKKYTEAMKHLSRSNFRVFIFKVQVKILLLEIYYKLSMAEEVLGMVDTFRHFVSREENLISEHKESYLQFLRLVSDLVKIPETNTEERDFMMAKIKKEAGEIPANPFRIKIWLMEEIEQLLR